MFTGNATVLLHNSSAQIWGTAVSVQALDIYLDGEKVASNVPVDPTNSSWEATLPPVRTGYNRTVKFVPSSGGQSYTTLISFGYVLLCAGQVSAQVDSTCA